MDEDSLRARLEFLEELARELYRRSVLTDDILDAVAARFDSKAEAGSGGADVAAHCAHMARALPFEAHAQTQAEWEAELSSKRADERRSRLRIVPDGGNDTA